MIDFSKTKFRASSWGNLLTEPQSKADREAGKLGVTCQKELIKIYNQAMYGRKRDVVTKQMEKGLQCEEDSITLASRVEKKLFTKNEEQLENEWFKGHPDIFTGESVYAAEECHDIKSSWDLDTFMPKLIEEPDKTYVCQLNVYYDLTGAKSGSILYCLVSAPPNIVQSEKKSLLYRMDVISEYSPSFVDAAQELEKLMVFEDIDYRERVIKVPVLRDDALIQKMKDKVPVLRAWLQNFHERHMNLYPKQKVLVISD